MKLLLSSLCFVAAFVPQSTQGFSVVSNSKTLDTTTALFSATTEQPGTAELDKPWTELGFEFRPTNSHLRMTFKDGEWGAPELVKDPYINLHIGATALHYGQACFEGLKAFCHEDNSVHIFRPDENAKRLRSSCERIMMPFPSQEEFLQACTKVVQDNIAYVPPYGSGGALYLRPLLFGSGPRIGLQPADEYTFLIMAIPVGDYYKGGLASPVDGMIIRDFDRAAPRGVGNVKVAGNYAADLLPNQQSKKKGYPIGLYLDSATQTMVEEFSTSNFVGIDKENKKYITPYAERSVLPSITNKSLMTLAEKELGFTVERRSIKLEELSTFDEVVACGTAVVVTPVGSLTDINQDGEETKYSFGSEVGTTTRQLFDTVRAIQFGESEDKFGWNYKVC